MTAPVASTRLIEMLRDARARTLELVVDLEPEQLFGPRLDIVNPLLWEIGHLAWFHEHFILRRRRWPREPAAQCRRPLQLGHRAAR